mgnify:CR=1 FL=1
MRINPWYFDPIAASSRRANTSNGAKKESSLGAIRAGGNIASVKGPSTTASTTTNPNEIVDIMNLISQSETLSNQVKAQTGAQKTATQSTLTGILSRIQTMLTTSKSGGTDFLEGEGSQQGQWGICYAISSLYSIGKTMASTVLSKIKNMFSVTSNGNIQVTFAKDANGNAFTKTQIERGVNKSIITSEDLKYIYSKGLFTRAAESAGDIIALAYGKMRAAMGGNLKPTAAQATVAASGGVPAYFMAALGAGTASYFFPSQYSDSTLIQTIQAALTAKKALVGASNGSGTQIVASHAYTIVGMDSKNNIIIRNPWGVDGSTGNIKSDGKNDGLITLTPAQFKANFSYISTLAA